MRFEADGTGTKILSAPPRRASVMNNDAERQCLPEMIPFPTSFFDGE